MMDQSAAIIENLYGLKEPHFKEVYEVRTFHCYRTTKDGALQRVTVEILDAGPHHLPDLRYSVRAASDDGKRAAGSPVESIELALMTTHWNELDT